jgi:aspartokinase
MSYLTGLIKCGGSPLDGGIYSIATFMDRITFEVKEPTILVISAFKNVTNMLERIALYLSAGEKDKAEKQKRELLEIHLSLAFNIFHSECGVFEKIVSIVESIDTSKYLHKGYNILCGEILGKGEDLSSLIISEYLSSQYAENKLVDSRKFIFTDGIVNSNISWLGETRKKISDFFDTVKVPLVVMQGFVGTDSASGKPAVMQREYSDVSAVAVSGVLGTTLTFWKKRGVVGDPSEISFQEFLETEEGVNNKLIAGGALQLITEYKKSFSVVNFDTGEKTLVHF